MFNLESFAERNADAFDTLDEGVLYTSLQPKQEGRDLDFPLFVLSCESELEDHYVRFVIVPVVPKPAQGWPEDLYEVIRAWNHELPECKFAFNYRDDLELIFDIPAHRLDETELRRALQILGDYAAEYLPVLETMVGATTSPADPGNPHERTPNESATGAAPLDLRGYFASRGEQVDEIGAEGVGFQLRLPKADDPDEMAPVFPLTICPVTDNYDDRYIRFEITPFLRHPSTDFDLQSLMGRIAGINYALPHMKLAVDSAGEICLLLDLPADLLTPTSLENTIETLHTYARAYHRILSRFTSTRSNS